MLERSLTIFPKKLFDFASLPAGQTSTTTVVECCDVSCFGDGVMLLKVHSKNFTGSGTSITINVWSAAPSEEDPAVTFVVDKGVNGPGPVATLVVDANVVAGDLVLGPFNSGFGGAIEVELVASKGSGGTTLNATLSADLVLRSGVAAKRTWAETLETGNTSGGTDAVMSAGDVLRGVDGGTPSLLSLRGGNSTGAGVTGGDVDVVGGAPGTGNVTGASLNFLAGDGSGNGVGGDANLVAGDGGTTGVGGEVAIAAGTGGSTSGTGGRVAIAAGNGHSSATTAVGGEFIASAGIGRGAGAGGLAQVLGGTPGATGTGGALVLKSGPGGSTSGASGAVTIQSGTTTSGATGNITLSAPAATSGGGGDIVITAGDSVSSEGGEVLITSGSNSSGNSSGGEIILTTGDGAGNAAGGFIILTTGIGGPTNGNGGSIQMTCGNAGGGTGDGGNIDLTAGARNGTGVPGAVSLNTTSIALSNWGGVTINTLGTSFDEGATPSASRWGFYTAGLQTVDGVPAPAWNTIFTIQSLGTNGRNIKIRFTVTGHSQTDTTKANVIALEEVWYRTGGANAELATLHETTGGTGTFAARITAGTDPDILLQVKGASNSTVNWMAEIDFQLGGMGP